MSNIIPFQAGQLPASVLQAMQAMQSSELSENVGANFAVVSIKGKVFRIKHGGQEYPLMMEHQGSQYPAPNFDVIIPKANGPLSKTFYAAGYSEGSDAQPDCWSEDGVHPLSPMEKRPLMLNGQGQSVPCTDCRMCPNNVFGSKVNEVTKKGTKACADTRKVIINPAGDIANERFGGAMLLRVPAASLGPLAEYDRKLKAAGIPYFAVVTRITFDQTVAYPKLDFAPLRMITDAEAAQILEVRTDSRTDLILNSGQVVAPTGMEALAGQAVPAALAAPQAPVQQQYPVQQQSPVQQQAAPAAAYAPPPAVFVPPAPQAAPAPSPTVSFGAPVANVQPMAPAPAMGTVQPMAPAPVGPAVDASFFAGVDALINS